MRRRRAARRARVLVHRPHDDQAGRGGARTRHAAATGAARAARRAAGPAAARLLATSTPRRHAAREGRQRCRRAAREPPTSAPRRRCPRRPATMPDLGSRSPIRRPRSPRSTSSKARAWTTATSGTWRRRRRRTGKALVIDPDLVPAIVNLANIHYARDELIEAQALYERAIGLEPDCFEAHFNLGNIHHDLGRYDDALALLPRRRRAQPRLRRRALLPGGDAREDRALAGGEAALEGVPGARARRASGWSWRRSSRNRRSVNCIRQRARPSLRVGHCDL